MLSDSISDRTLALLFLYNSVATRLMCRLICTNNANVPADLQSAGIEYKDFQSDYFLF